LVALDPTATLRIAAIRDHGYSLLDGNVGRTIALKTPIDLTCNVSGAGLTTMAIAAAQISGRSDIDGDVANQAVGTPIEIELAVELLADARHHAGAETLARRRRHRRSAGFDPAHGQPVDR
jgi:hypothetical protein